MTLFNLNNNFFRRQRKFADGGHISGFRFHDNLNRPPNQGLPPDPLMHDRDGMLVGGRESMLVGGRETMLLRGMGSSLDGDVRMYDSGRLHRRSSRQSQDLYSLHRVCNMFEKSAT